MASKPSGNTTTGEFITFAGCGGGAGGSTGVEPGSDEQPVNPIIAVVAMRIAMALAFMKMHFLQ